MKKSKTYLTYWGKYTPFVDTFPIKYLLFIYLIGFLLPYIVFGDKTLLRFWAGKESLAEFIQFFEFFISSILCFLIYLKNKDNITKKEKLAWILVSTTLLFISFEEISLLDLINDGIPSLRDLNIQGESNIHNLKILSSIIQPIYILFNLILGYLGQKIWPNNNILPSPFYSLYFLFPALFYTAFLFSQNPNVMTLPYHHEIFEFLTATGIFLHCLKKYRKKNNKLKC